MSSVPAAHDTAEAGDSANAGGDRETMSDTETAEVAETAPSAAGAPEVQPSAEAPAEADGGRDVIRVTGLTKTFANGLVAVDGMDLSVRRGEIFGLLGPNGAGKSTTVGMLTTRVMPTAGQAVVHGIDVVGDPVRAKQAIGVVSQANTLDQGLTAWENLWFHGRYFGMSASAARTAADEMLERFRLSDKRTVDVETLSGGMARRLMVARALLHRPAVIFLDEPTAGLDPQSRIALWEILGELHAEGQTILVTTHLMQEADDHCDRVAIMDHGRILAVDTPARLKATLGSGAAVIMRADGDAAALAERIGATTSATDVRPVEGGVRFQLPATEGVLAQVVSAAEAGHFRITDLSVSEDTLETVFINLTGKDLRE